jgi:hypothetical protein
VFASDNAAFPLAATGITVAVAVAGLIFGVIGLRDRKRGVLLATIGLAISLAGLIAFVWMAVLFLKHPPIS